MIFEPHTAAARSQSPIPSASEIASLVGGGLFGTEYQPVIEVCSGAVIGHEALSRFFDGEGRPVSPGPVFARLHEEPSLLIHVETETKRFQLENAPGGTLYLNVDPDSFHAASLAGRDSLLEGMASRPEGVVVEVIESLSISDAHRGRDMVTALRKRGIGVALDDVGALDTLVSLESLRDADVLKLDASWLARASAERDRAVLEMLLALARRLGTRTVLEGIETKQQLALARCLGVDAVQGFLFRGQFTVCRAA